ncbi:hypothetical protein [Nonomuraea sp. KM88]|uniref:hypothetical protein n=1 Tax=Nonomuraea sp. KM88 TaxID=3457427 RepID=UPI003FCE85D0
MGRRDHLLLLVAMQTGLRVSELTSLTCADAELGWGAHLHCTGKGRKQRTTPLTRPAPGHRRYRPPGLALPVRTRPAHHRRERPGREHGPAALVPRLVAHRDHRHRPRGWRTGPVGPVGQPHPPDRTRLRRRHHGVRRNVADPGRLPGAVHRPSTRRARRRHPRAGRALVGAPPQACPRTRGAYAGRLAGHRPSRRPGRIPHPIGHGRSVGLPLPARAGRRPDRRRRHQRRPPPGIGARHHARRHPRPARGQQEGQPRRRTRHRNRPARRRDRLARPLHHLDHPTGQAGPVRGRQPGPRTPASPTCAVRGHVRGRQVRRRQRPARRPDRLPGRDPVGRRPQTRYGTAPVGVLHRPDRHHPAGSGGSARRRRGHPRRPRRRPHHARRTRMGALTGTARADHRHRRVRRTGQRGTTRDRPRRLDRPPWPRAGGQPDRRHPTPLQGRDGQERGPLPDGRPAVLPRPGSPRRRPDPGTGHGEDRMASAQAGRPRQVPDQLPGTRHPPPRPYVPARRRGRTGHRRTARRPPPAPRRGVRSSPQTRGRDAHPTTTAHHPPLTPTRARQPRTSR